MCQLSWFLDPGGWSKAAVVGLYFIFPGICTLSLQNVKCSTIMPVGEECQFEIKSSFMTMRNLFTALQHNVAKFSELISSANAFKSTCNFLFYEV
ncbi:hypothetical protein STEG23_018237 [Scotinomys teguina]